MKLSLLVRGAKVKSNFLEKKIVCVLVIKKMELLLKIPHEKSLLLLIQVFKVI